MVPTNPLYSPGVTHACGAIAADSTGMLNMSELDAVQTTVRLHGARDRFAALPAMHVIRDTSEESDIGHMKCYLDLPPPGLLADEF